MNPYYVNFIKVAQICINNQSYITMATQGIHDLAGDRSSEMLLTKLVYRCDFICVFFFPGTPLPPDPFLSLFRQMLVLLCNYLGGQLLFYSSSENYKGSSEREAAYSVELDLFLPLYLAATRLVGLRFWECELERASLEICSSQLGKGRSSSEQSFSVDQLRSDEFQENNQPSQTSSQPSLVRWKLVGRLFSPFNSPSLPTNTVTSLLLLDASISQSLKQRSVLRSLMKRLQRQKLTLFSLTALGLRIKYSF